MSKPDSPQTVDKKKVYAAITDALEALVENARKAVQLAYDAATHEENVAENKYDTLGLEASYLTQGQARRLAECESDLSAFQNLQPKFFNRDDAIDVGALIQLLDAEDRSTYFFLGPAAGGLKLSLADHNVMVITPSSPLGKALLKHHVGDEIAVPVAARKTIYEVLSIW